MVLEVGTFGFADGLATTIFDGVSSVLAILKNKAL
jgi:hypothetical protein